MKNPYTETLKPLWRNQDRIHIFVGEERLREVADQLKKERLEIPPWAVPNVHPPMDCGLEDWVNYICWINTVNFAFTNFEPPYNKFSVEYPRGTIWNGAFALGASFMRARAGGFPIFDAKRMSQISFEEALHLFRPIDENHKMPMILERFGILQEVGMILLEKYNGSWLNLFEKADWLAFNNGKGIIDRLIFDFPSFYDARVFGGKKLHFQKRAQLLAMMYQDRALHFGGKFPLIKDAENLGPPCDYELPKALEFLGVLRYSDELKIKIKNRVITPENSREEIEIRVATWYAMEKLCEMLGTWIGPVDFKIWNMGRQSKEPHHLTSTIAY